MKKKVLYLDLPYHRKTKSSLFLLELLKKYYTVDVYYYDTNLQIIREIRSILDKEYDFLICWQVMPEEFLLNQLNYKKGIFFPMYDNVVMMPDDNWTRFSRFTIISFSRVLYENLLGKGFNVKYIQYFPEIQPVNRWGNKKSMFFWQRTNQIDANLIFKLCEKLKVEKIHIHKALDPGFCFKNVDSCDTYDIEYTNWFQNREELLDIIMQSSYYAAPRIYEGIGMSFLEAMALGRCVIAPDYPTMNEYIINGETGLLYNYQNPELLEMPNIEKIQKNTYEYMSEGYLIWEKEKGNIIEWIEEQSLQQSENREILCGTYREDKFKSYFKLLNKWLLLKNKGIEFKDFFLHYEIYNIAIYGGGEVAHRLLEELNGTSIRVVCIIDQNSKKVDTSLPIMSPDEDIPELDAIVVTPVYLFGQIYLKLIKRVDCKIISMCEIVDFEFYN